MKNKKLFKPIEITTMVLGLLVGIFMMIFLIAKQQWAFYIELALVPPFWCLLTTTLITNHKDKKEKKDENKSQRSNQQADK